MRHWIAVDVQIGERTATVTGVYYSHPATRWEPGDEGFGVETAVFEDGSQVPDELLEGDDVQERLIEAATKQDQPDWDNIREAREDREYEHFIENRDDR